MRKEPTSMPAATAQLYEAAEVVLDDSDSFYRNWLDAGRQQLKFFDHYLGSFHGGTDAVAKKALALAAANGNAAFHFARKLMRAKNANEVFALQLEFYQQQLATFAAQMHELGQTVIKAAERAN